jgi:hypothetical protein
VLLADELVRYHKVLGRTRGRARSVGTVA